MCSYIVEKTALVGSAKGRKGWMRIDTANVYFDHPYHSTLDHVLAIDFTNEGEGGRDRVAIELSADSARALVERILAALASGELAHGGSGGRRRRLWQIRRRLRCNSATTTARPRALGPGRGLR